MLLSRTGAELLLEMITHRYERGFSLITRNLPFDERTETFGSERLAGALLDRLTHHVIILEMNGDSYGSPRVARKQPQPTPDARQPGWPFGPTRLGTRQLLGERACQGALALTQHQFPILRWQTFAPPRGWFFTADDKIH